MNGIHVDGQGGDGHPADGAHALQLQVNRVHMLFQALAVVEGLLTRGTHHFQTLSIKRHVFCIKK